MWWHPCFGSWRYSWLHQKLLQDKTRRNVEENTQILFAILDSWNPKDSDLSILLNAVEFYGPRTELFNPEMIYDCISQIKLDHTYFVAWRIMDEMNRRIKTGNATFGLHSSRNIAQHLHHEIEDFVIRMAPLHVKFSTVLAAVNATREKNISKIINEQFLLHLERIKKVFHDQSDWRLLYSASSCFASLELMIRRHDDYYVFQTLQEKTQCYLGFVQCLGPINDVGFIVNRNIWRDILLKTVPDDGASIQYVQQCEQQHRLCAFH